MRGAYSVVKVQVIRFVGAKGRRVEAVLAGVLVAFLSAALPSVRFQAGKPPWVEGIGGSIQPSAVSVQPSGVGGRGRRVSYVVMRPSIEQ